MGSGGNPGARVVFRCVRGPGGRLTRLGSHATQSPQLGGDVGPRPSLPAPRGDRRLQPLQCGDEHLDARYATHPPTVLQPSGDRLVTSLAVAAAACRHLVLQPARPPLDAGNQMLGRGAIEAFVEGRRAPHAPRAVAFQDPGHSLPAVGLPRRAHGLDPVRNIGRPERCAWTLGLLGFAITVVLGVLAQRGEESPDKGVSR